MTIRILADREPYASYASFGQNEGPHARSFVFLGGPASLDEPEPDFLVLPARDFLLLPNIGLRRYGCIAYGPVDLMERVFARDCSDYLREPWSMYELCARLLKYQRLRVRAGGKILCLVGSRLSCDIAEERLKPNELAFFSLLIRASPRPVSNETASSCLASSGLDEKHALGRCAIALRRHLDALEPGLGRLVRVVRGQGYRFDGERCG